MIALFATLFGYLVLAGSAFLVSMGRPWKHADKQMAWLWSGGAGLALGVDAVWFLALIGVVGTWSIWILAAFLAAQGAFFTWRLWLRLKSRRRSQC